MLNLIKKNKTLISNLLWRAIQLFSRQGISLIVFFIIAQAISKEDFGRYNYVLAILALLTILGDFGLSTATSKYYAEHLENKSEKVHDIFPSIISTLGILSLCIIGFLLIFEKQIFGDSLEYVIYIFPLIFLVPATSLLDGIYRAKGIFKKLSLFNLISGLVFLCLVFILTNTYGVRGALVANIFNYLILFVLLLISGPKLGFKINRKLTKEILKYSTIIGIATLSHFFYSRVDTLFLGSYGYVTQISYFEIIYKLILLAVLPFDVIAQVIGPSTTRIFISANRSNLWSKYKKYMTLSFVLSIIIFIVALIGFPLFVKILPKYDVPEIKSLFLLLLPVFFTQALTGIITTGFLIPIGKAKISMYFLITFAIVNVSLNYILINILGYIGIAYSTLVTKLVTDASFLIYSTYIINKESRISYSKL